MRTVFTLEVDTSKFDDQEIAGEFILRMVERHNRLWLSFNETNWTESNKDGMRELIATFTAAKEAAFAAAKVFDATIGTAYIDLIQARISEVTGEQFS